MDQPNPLMHLKFQLGQSEPHQQDLLRISLANFGPEKVFIYEPSLHLFAKRLKLPNNLEEILLLYLSTKFSLGEKKMHEHTSRVLLIIQSIAHRCHLCNT